MGRKVKVLYTATVLIRTNLQQVKQMVIRSGGKVILEQKLKGNVLLKTCFKTSDSRQQWEEFVEKINPKPQTFYTSAVQILGKEPTVITAHVKDKLHFCKGWIYKEVVNDTGMFILVNFSQPELRLFWENQLDTF